MPRRDHHPRGRPPARTWAHEFHFDRNCGRALRRVLCPKSARQLASQHAPLALHFCLRCPHFDILPRDRARHAFTPWTPGRSADTLSTITLRPDFLHNLFDSGRIDDENYSLHRPANPIPPHNRNVPPSSARADCFAVSGHQRINRLGRKARRSFDAGSRSKILGRCLTAVLTAAVGCGCSLPGVSVIVPADVEIDTREARPNAVTQRDLGGRVAR